MEHRIIILAVVVVVILKGDFAELAKKRKRFAIATWHSSRVRWVYTPYADSPDKTCSLLVSGSFPSCSISAMTVSHSGRLIALSWDRSLCGTAHHLGLMVCNINFVCLIMCTRRRSSYGRALDSHARVQFPASPDFIFCLISILFLFFYRC
jgi:hypothetical protein